MIPANGTTCDVVDLIEVSHVYDEQGQHQFNQMIFYDWQPLKGGYQVCAWRLLKTVGQRPRWDWAGGYFVTAWMDDDLFRVVIAPAVRRTWTLYDPELLERQKLPCDKRRGLRHIPQLQSTSQ